MSRVPPIQNVPFTLSAPPVIGLLLPDSAFFAHPDFRPLFAAAGAIAARHGCDLLVSAQAGNSANLTAFLPEIDGVLFANHNPAPDVLAAVQAQVPCAVAGAPETMEQVITELIAALEKHITE